METKHTSDRLIREKLDRLPTFPGNGGFDKEKVWNRLQFRMGRHESRKIFPWRYAAAFLVLLTALYGFPKVLRDTKRFRLQHDAGLMADSSNKAGRSTQFRKPPRKEVAVRVAEQKTGVKTGTARETNRKAIAAVRNATLTVTPVNPDLPAREDSSTYERSNLLMPAENKSSPGELVKVDRATVSKLPVVHLNEISERGKQDVITPEKDSRSRLTVRFADGTRYPAPLLATQTTEAVPVKIKFSSEK